LSRRKPASETQLEAFERKHGITLPASYREYMKVRGGGTPEPNCFFDEVRGILLFVGLIFSLDDELMAEQFFPFPPARESGLLPVATTGGGNYFLIELKTGKVFYWDHEIDDVDIGTEDLLWLAPSLGALVEGLVHPPGERPERVDEIEEVGRSGSLEELEEFVARRGIEARNAAGRTVAEEAARYESLPLVRRCLELGATMRHLLHFAAQGENLALVTYLVDRGAGINDLDERGETPLDRAISPETYELLVRLGGVHAKRGKPPHLVS
jgi:hypothetical protein